MKKRREHRKDRTEILIERYQEATRSSRRIVDGYPKTFPPDLARYINWETFGAARLELRCHMEATENEDGSVTVTLFWTE